MAINGTPCSDRLSEIPAALDVCGLSGDYIFSFQSKILRLVGRSEFLFEIRRVINSVLSVW